MKDPARDARMRIVVTLAFVAVGVIAGITSGSSLVFVGMVAAALVVNVAMRIAARR